MKKVCVMGLGYIGLPTAAVLADNGFFVHGVDINEYAVKKIQKGEVHIYEPNLAQKVKQVVMDGLLKASTTPTYADVFIISVPTPFKENHEPDLSFVEAATKSIAPYIEPGNVVILESTSPVGTTEKIAGWISDTRKDIDMLDQNVYIAHCPERVLPGKILEELISNDRIVGGINQESTQKAAQFYGGFVKGEIHRTNARTAEMSKLAENSFRDVNIAFANELSIICDELQIDVWELIQLANRHPRVDILQPGPGVGGHCIAVDPWFIINSVPKQSRLIQEARKVNDSKPEYVIEKVKEATKNITNPKIACLGLSFKANIDDLRESPAVNIVKNLASKNKKVYVAEPHIEELPVELRNENITLSKTDEAIKNSDIVVLLVDHDYFKAIDSKYLQDKIVIDTKGVLARVKTEILQTI
ncbi:UDP-N-acetyl-D-mannosamine dehydrogenase [Siminovitchia terrae]|uniref:UDP-N-acetyl-D-mannosamine dehydrogenase n=1 Tax=Siminovitchia terrae TaxID=1914933 RepID=UPI001B057402|nr:UDP-N-acetyl-D-mannosamine dehydrogenase [Siminovitchia terrae]GIN90675.1 UDP-N-acetyl-D-mannosamine dehydrogenase [Siminovitchia terrae]